MNNDQVSTLLTHEQFMQNINSLTTEIGKIVVGQQTLIRNLLIAILVHGHILLEGVPGLAKTLSIETLAKTLGVAYGRIQFTPDLLPSDLLGSTIFNPQEQQFVVKKGPLFTNLLLADEINRAPAKVQSALLEAMAERHVTIGDETFQLDEPFVVMATQNPLEQEGTYALPEAQLDRFLLKTVVTYPTPEEELLIMKTMHGGEKPTVDTMWTHEHLAIMQSYVQHMHVSDALLQYVNNLIFATRFPDEYGCVDIAQYIAFGVSPRGSLGLISAAKVVAAMQGRTYLLPEDIQAIAYDVLRHRIVLTFQAIAENVTTDEIIRTLLATVPVVDE